MNGPMISIITPSYNQAEFLEKNLQSVRDQEYNNVEHIVIDGGSNDGTVDLLRKYETQYNLKWISEPDRGQSHAVNKGIDMARGEWVGWQNSDDYYLPGAFNTVINEQKANPDIDVIYGDTLIVDQSGEEISKTFHTRPSKFVQKHWSLIAGNQSLFIRRKIITDIGGLNENLRYTMDAELTWDLLEQDYNYSCVHEALGAFRIQEDAKTFGDIKNEQQAELSRIYPHSWYENIIPKKALEMMAKALKAVYLLSDGRVDAIKYNIRN